MKMLMRYLCFILLVLWFPLTSYAAPDLSRQADLTVLSQPNSGYHFHTLAYTSVDGKRQYRVFVGIPTAPAPKSGYAAVFALDGNALLENLRADVLRRLRTAPPVLVLIGYATPLRFSTSERAFDYTPAGVHGEVLPDGLDNNRLNGGAAEFLHLIQQQIMPAVAQLAHLNPQQRVLWGHSYGALFVLHTLLNQPELFSHYIAADPALWWQQGLWLRHYAPLLAQQSFAGQTVWLLKSTVLEQKNANNPQQAQRVYNHQRLTQSISPQATHQLAQYLASLTQLTVYYQAYPQHTHGSLLPASFIQTLLGAYTAQGFVKHLPQEES